MAKSKSQAIREQCRLAKLEVLLEKDPAQRFQSPGELLKTMPATTPLSMQGAESLVRA
ncbi:MAG: hypothetical protein JO151_04125 [Verrucomicrobia bacterium]|nr:hypothetical protein [Verrucomicrobiota bacterium]